MRGNICVAGSCKVNGSSTVNNQALRPNLTHLNDSELTFLFLPFLLLLSPCGHNYGLGVSTIVVANKLIVVNLIQVTGMAKKAHR